MTFDPACEFLLDMRFENLFEATSSTGLDFRCKGCREPVRRWEREAHFKRHCRDRERTRVHRAEQVRREAAKRLRRTRHRRTIERG